MTESTPVNNFPIEEHTPTVNMEHSKESIQKTIQLLVQQELGWTQEIPTENLSGYLDSIQRLNLLVCIEDHYRIAFEEEEDHSIDSLEQLIGLIRQKIQLDTPTDIRVEHRDE